MLLTASSDIKFHAWPINTDLDKIYRPPEQSKVVGLSLSSDDRYLTYVTSAGRADIINYKERDDIKFVHAITAINDVSCAAFQKTTKKNIALGTRESQLALYDTRNKVITRLFSCIPAPISYIDFNNDDLLLAVAIENGCVMLFDNGVGGDTTSAKSTYLLSRTCIPTGLRFHPTQPNILGACTDEGTVMMWDTTTSRKLFYAQTHSAPISGLGWAESSDLIVTVGADHKFCIHDLTIRECIFRSNLQRSLTAVDVSPDGTTVAIGAEDGLVHMYDLRNLLQPVAIFQAHSSAITKVLFENTIVDIPPCDEGPDPVCSKTRLQELSFSVFKPKSNISKLLKDNYFLVEAYSSRSTPKTATVEDNFNISTFKNSILKTVQKETNHVRHQMLCQMNHLQNFIHNEFRKMEAQLDDKWEVLNIASYVAKSNIEETMYEDSRSRTEFSESPEDQAVID